MRVCGGSADSCFTNWVDGSQRDNRGFLKAKCYCGLEVDDDDVKRLMGAEMFQKYQLAMLRQCLLRAGDAVFCPGADCGNALIRPAVVKGVSACRSTVCSECTTEFCVICSEKFVQGELSHAKLSCKSFNAILDKQSGVEEWVKGQKKNMVKKCPGCKKLVFFLFRCVGVIHFSFFRLRRMKAALPISVRNVLFISAGSARLRSANVMWPDSAG
jgi:hypothetical protein